MARVEVKVTGGAGLAKHLSGLAAKLGRGGVVRVGFLEGATYPAAAAKPGLNVAQVAFWNEFGTARTMPRPFFRGMIRADSPRWGRELAKIAQATHFDTERTLELMGQRIKDQLTKAIVDWPADNAPSTVARKGFNKGLIDTGVMQRSVDFEVVR